MVFVRRMHTYKLIIFRRLSLILDAYNFSPQLFTNFSYHCILVHQFTARASGIGYSSYWKKDQFLLGPLSYPKAAVSSLETLFIWKCSGVIKWFFFFFHFWYTHFSLKFGRRQFYFKKYKIHLHFCVHAFYIMKTSVDRKSIWGRSLEDIWFLGEIVDKKVWRRASRSFPFFPKGQNKNVLLRITFSSLKPLLFCGNLKRPTKAKL